MSGYGIFESAATDGHEQEQRHLEANRSLDSAIFAAREQFGSFLGEAETRADFDTRLALVKKDLFKVVEANGVMPVTGVMNKVTKALRPNFKARREALRKQAGLNWTNHRDGGLMAQVDERTMAYVVGNNWTVVDISEGYSDVVAEGTAGSEEEAKAAAEASVSGGTTTAERKRSGVEDAPILVPEGDWEGYLEDVSPQSKPAVEKHFVDKKASSSFGRGFPDGWEWTVFQGQHGAEGYPVWRWEIMKDFQVVEEDNEGIPVGDMSRDEIQDFLEKRIDELRSTTASRRKRANDDDDDWDWDLEDWIDRNSTQPEDIQRIRDNAQDRNRQLQDEYNRTYHDPEFGGPLHAGLRAAVKMAKQPSWDAADYDAEAMGLTPEEVQQQLDRMRTMWEKPGDILSPRNDPKDEGESVSLGSRKTAVEYNPISDLDPAGKRAIADYLTWARNNGEDPYDVNTLDVYNDNGDGSNALSEDDYNDIYDAIESGWDMDVVTDPSRLFGSKTANDGVFITPESAAEDFKEWLNGRTPDFDLFDEFLEQYPYADQIDEDIDRALVRVIDRYGSREGCSSKNTRTADHWKFDQAFQQFLLDVYGTTHGLTDDEIIEAMENYAGIGTTPEVIGEPVDTVPPTATPGQPIARRKKAQEDEGVFITPESAANDFREWLDGRTPDYDLFDEFLEQYPYADQIDEGIDRALVQVIDRYGKRRKKADYNRWEQQGSGSWIKYYEDDADTLGTIEQNPDGFSWLVADEDDNQIGSGVGQTLDEAIAQADAAFQGGGF